MRLQKKDFSQILPIFFILRDSRLKIHFYGLWEQVLVYNLHYVSGLGYEVGCQPGPSFSFDWKSTEHKSRAATGRKFPVVPFTASEVHFDGISPNLSTVS